MSRSALKLARCARRLLTVAIAVLFLSPGAGVAAVSVPPVDWSQVAVFSQDFPTTTPSILFGFDPQPEPPASSAIWRTTETTASRSIDGVSGAQLFTILIGLEKGGALDLAAVPTETAVGLLLPAVQSVREAARSVVKIDFFTSSGGTPLNILSFNPQPEPPPRLGGFEVWALQFEFSSLSTARVTFSVDDGDGTAVPLTRVALTPVPVPPAIVLGLGGIGALGALRLRRQGVARSDAAARGGASR